MRLLAYAGAVVAVAVASVLTLGIHPWMGTSVSVLFFPAVVIVAMYGGYGPALLATVLSTVSLAYFFISPRYSLDIGPDDAIRLAVFAGVAILTASLSVSRKRAEEQQRRALSELNAAVTVLRKVSDWPTFVDAGPGGDVRRLLAHAAAVVGCARVVAAWESGEEPWMFLGASDAPAVERVGPEEQSPFGILGSAAGATLACDTPRGERADASAAFELEELKGRVFFLGVPNVGPETIPLAEVVAREVGNSLELLTVHDRLRQLAVREDRVRVARDLHDGVLQSLTGIRLQLQAIASQPSDSSAISDHLLAMERAIAIEQRELRHFIDDLKPSGRQAGVSSGLARTLQDLRERLLSEWRTPIELAVTPPDLALPAGTGDGVRLLVREAVINALKHAQPSRVSIDVRQDSGGAVTIVVGSDGRGFPFRGRLTHEQLVAAGTGPVSLRERVEELHGALTIESAADGSSVEISLPKAYIV